VLVEVLSGTDGHVTGAELVERCRELDPGTIPSTVYRTLDVLEELGVLSHSHGADGREEFHVLPETEHGHLYCRRCGAQWDLASDDPAVKAAVRAFDTERGFAVDVSHLTMIGRCRACQADTDPTGDVADTTR
jgi:Fur family ferric uptake transcriptional regulator